MATVNKNFKIKSGLVVEGTTGTINGEDILTKAQADIDYIIAEVGGSGVSENTPDTLVLRDGSGNFAAGTVTVDGLTLGGAGSITDYLGDGDIRIQTTEGGDVDVYADDVYISAADDFRVEANDLIRLESTTGSIHLSAANAYFGTEGDSADRIATEGYVTDAIGNIDLTFNTDEISEGSTNLYFTNQRALDATSSAYDASGAAATAESNANSYTDTELADYTLTSDLDTTVGGYGYIKSADLSGYATESYVGTAIDNLVDGAPGLLDTLNEIAAAINDDENYATTMTTALSGKQNNLSVGDGLTLASDTLDLDIATSGGLYIDNSDKLAVDGFYVTFNSAEQTLTNKTINGTDNNITIVADDVSDFSTAALSATASAYDASGAAATAESNANSYTDTAIGNLDTDDIEEGATNQYFTDLRAKGSAADLLVNATKTNITITGNEDGLTITAEGGVGDATTDDLVEGEENLYFTDERAVDAVSGADIYPNAVILDNYRKEEAAHQYVTTASTVNVHSLSGTYESAKYLVRVVGTVGGTRHSQLTEILMTVDGSGNIAITEYGSIYTSENPLASFSATDVAGSATLTATTLVANTEIIAAATLLSWAD